METLAIIATVCATLITVIWFIRDVRKENSKVLKKIEEGQRGGFVKQAEISEKISLILERIEKGQEELAKILAKTTWEKGKTVASEIKKANDDYGIDLYETGVMKYR